jgi:hypothetical protein
LFFFEKIWGGRRDIYIYMDGQSGGEEQKGKNTITNSKHFGRPFNQL